MWIHTLTDCNNKTHASQEWWGKNKKKNEQKAIDNMNIRMHRIQDATPLPYAKSSLHERMSSWLEGTSWGIAHRGTCAGQIAHSPLPSLRPKPTPTNSSQPGRTKRGHWTNRRRRFSLQNCEIVELSLVWSLTLRQHLCVGKTNFIFRDNSLSLVCRGRIDFASFV